MSGHALPLVEKLIDEDAGVSRVFRTQTTGVAGTNHYSLEGHDHYPKPEQGTSRAYTSAKYRHSMLRCEAIAAHMLKPAEVAAEFLKQQPQFAEMGEIGHAGSQYGALRFA